jgi:hypothetical protein
VESQRGAAPGAAVTEATPARLVATGRSAGWPTRR